MIARSRRPARLALVALALAFAAACAGDAGSDTSLTDGRTLRVCADPNNLPFSNDRGEGFENRLAEMIAADLGATLEYTWWAQRRGFVRNTVRAGTCDVVMGVPLGFDPLATTRPYYRSSYLFLHRRDRGVAIASLDDPVLRTLRIGVHAVGDDYSNPPPAHALAWRGLTPVGYSIYGDYREPNPPARLVEAAVEGEVDVAIVWGPFAGYFTRHQADGMTMIPVPPVAEAPALAFAFDIAVGVHREQEPLRTAIDAVLARRARDIRRLLDEYHIPLVAASQPAALP